MTVRPVEELIEELEGGLATPVAQALRHDLLSGSRSAAMRILTGEGFKDKDEREALFNELLRQTRGVDLELVELPRDQWLIILKSGISPLVRYGTKLGRASWYDDSRVYMGGEMLALKDISQLWECREKGA